MYETLTAGTGRGTYLCNVRVFNTSSFIQVFPFHPLSGQAAAGDGGATTKRLELGVSDLAIIVNLVKLEHYTSV